MSNFLHGLCNIWQTCATTLAFLCSWPKRHGCNGQILNNNNNIAIWSHCTGRDSKLLDDRIDGTFWIRTNMSEHLFHVRLPSSISLSLSLSLSNPISFHCPEEPKVYWEAQFILSWKISQLKTIKNWLDQVEQKMAKR